MQMLSPFDRPCPRCNDLASQIHHCDHFIGRMHRAIKVLVKAS